MKILSLDRFFLPQGFLLFLNTAAITTVVGLLFSIQHSVVFYTMLMGGFIIALLAEKFAFPNAELKSEVFSGVIFMLAGSFDILHKPSVGHPVHLSIPDRIWHWCNRKQVPAVLYQTGQTLPERNQSEFIFPVLGIRNQPRTVFRIWLLGKSQNCRTAKVLAQIQTDHEYILAISIVLLVLTLVFYNYCVHPWYMKHRNR